MSEFIPLKQGDRIFVAGHRGLAGSALVRELKNKNFSNILTQTRSELDLRQTDAVSKYFQRTKPDVIFLAAAKVGGIKANNDFPVEFLVENLAIQNSVIMAAHQHNVRMVVALGSSCIYPRDCPQPMKESALLTGILESTNRPYAIAKIAALELISALNRQYGRRYFGVMPTNLYGPFDNFDPTSSHVLPALLRRFHEAKINRLGTVKIWGSGRPMREFMYADDCARAIITAAQNLREDFFADALRSSHHQFHINIGSSDETTINNLAKTISNAVNYQGKIEFDTSMPDGTPRKLLDCTRLNALGFQPATDLKTGIKNTYEWFLQNLPAAA